MLLICSSLISPRETDCYYRREQRESCLKPPLLVQSISEIYLTIKLARWLPLGMHIQCISVIKSSCWGCVKVQFYQPCFLAWSKRESVYSERSLTWNREPEEIEHYRLLWIPLGACSHLFWGPVNQWFVVALTPRTARRAKRAGRWRSAEQHCCQCRER